MRPLAVYAKMDLSLRSAQGVWLQTEQGERILDFYSGHGVVSIGHSHPRFVASLKEQLDRFVYYSNAVDYEEQTALCERLGPLSACPGYDIFLANSGAEAVENAFKVASYTTGRTKIVAMLGSFHGRSSLAAQATEASKICAPINAGLDVSFIPLDDFEAARAAVDERTAAVIIEGIQGVGGIHEGSSSFWAELRRLCDQRGALLIADEIQSGFGRTGHFFAFQHHGIEPDVICTAKGMGNGYPVAATWIRNTIAMAQGSLGTTFGGNPMACRAALTVCEVIEDEGLMENAAVQGQWLFDELQNLQGIHAVRGRGLMLAFDVEGDSYPLRSRLLHNFRVISGNARQKATVRLLPPLTVTRENCEFFLQQLHSALKESL